MSTKKTPDKTKPSPKDISKTKIEMVFGRQNYILTGAAFAVVLIGFLLMYGDKEDIYSFRRITLAPIVVISGFILAAFAIMFKSKNTNGAD